MKKKALSQHQQSFDSADKSILKEETKENKPIHNPFQCKMYNKMEDNFHLSNKKALFLNMKIYYEAMGKDPFTALPVTFHVKEGVDSTEWNTFKQYYDKSEKDLLDYK